MSAQLPRLAIVGYGAIAEKHIEVFRALGAEITASCNRSEVGRRRAAKKGVIQHIYADPMDMVNKERPDGLLVTASVFSLFDLAKRLIPCGIPMLMEKPPGLSLGQAQELAGLSRRHGTHVMVGLNRRFYTVYQQTLASMGGREAVTGVYVEWSEDPQKMLSVGHPPAVLPVLNFANSLHGIDLLTFFAGEIQEPRFWGRNLGGSAESFRLQMSVEGVAQYGARVRFDSNWDVPGRWRLVVDFPGARLVSAPLETGSLLLYGKSPQDVLPGPEDSSFKAGFYGQAKYFLDVVRTGKTVAWPACSIAEACTSMALAEGLTAACNN